MEKERQPKLSGLDNPGKGTSSLVLSLVICDIDTQNELACIFF